VPRVCPQLLEGPLLAVLVEQLPAVASAASGAIAHLLAVSTGPVQAQLLQVDRH
jgi:hypothetical protein